MAFDLSSLTAYVEENRADLITKPITTSRTFDFVDVRQGIKSGEKIPIIESTTPFQAGSSCGFTSSGTTTISQTTLNTTSIKVQEAICLQDLEAYFTQKWLPSGAKPESTDIAQDIINRKIANISRRVGQMVWQGNTSYTNDTALKQMNGWLKLIDDQSASTVNATQQSDITTSTVRGIFEEIIFQLLPQAVKDSEPALVFCGNDTLRILLQKFMIDNMYHIMPSSGDWSKNEFVYPGTDVRIIGLSEMNANNPVDTGTLPSAVKDRIVAGSAKNFVAGFDVENDKSDFNLWWSEDNQQFRMNCRFRIGVTNHFYDQIVQYKNS